MKSYGMQIQVDTQQEIEVYREKIEKEYAGVIRAIYTRKVDHTEDVFWMLSAMALQREPLSRFIGDHTGENVNAWTYELPITVSFLRDIGLLK